MSTRDRFSGRVGRCLDLVEVREKLDSQPPGKQIIPTLKTGDRMECRFGSSRLDNLTVTVQSGIERKVPKSEVLNGLVHRCRRHLV